MTEISLLEKGIKMRNQAGTMHTYSFPDEKTGFTVYIFIDLVHSYVNIFKPKIENITITNAEMINLLKSDVWVYEMKKQEGLEKQHETRINLISPIEVLNQKEKPEVKMHWDLISTADTSFPLYVFMDKNNWILFDGWHRLASIYHKNPDAEFYSLKVIYFDEKLIKKMSISVNPEKPLVLFYYMLIEKFFNEFCKKKK